MSGEGNLSSSESLLRDIKGTNRAVAHGIHTSVTGDDDNIATGLGVVDRVLISMEDDPVDGCMYCTALKGTNAGTINIKTWLNTDADATHVIATTFSKKFHWVAFGTP